MARTVALRFIRLVAVLWVVSLGSFFLLNLIPGDPVVAVLGRNAPPSQYAFVRRQLGLDRPIVSRYAHWLGGLLTGHVGDTIVPPVQSVTHVIGQALPITLEISALALIIALLAGLPLGIWAAYRAGGLVDKIISTFNFGLISVPVFVMGLVLIVLLVFNTPGVALAALILGAIIDVSILARSLLPERLAGRPRTPLTPPRVAAVCLVGAIAVVVYLLLPVFPRQGWVPIGQSPSRNIRSAFLPALTLAMGLIPLYALVLRNDMRQTLQQNYIVIARAKGMTTRHVLFREALRPSLFSLITVAGISFGSLLGGSVIVESLYNLPGLGSLLVSSIQAKDFPVVQVGVVVVAGIFVILNAIVDAGYSLLDPRIRRASH